MSILPTQFKFMRLDGQAVDGQDEAKESDESKSNSGSRNREKTSMSGNAKLFFKQLQMRAE